MSGTAMVWARSRKTGNATSKALLMLMGELADDTGRCYRDQRYMADILEVSRETVSRNMGLLEKSGFIRREQRFTPDRKRRTDRIILLMESSFTVSNPPCDEEPHGSENHVTETGKPCDADGPSHVPLQHTKEKLQTNLKEETTSSDAASPDARIREMAKAVHENTKGGYGMMAVMGITKSCVKAGFDIPAVYMVLGQLWRAGKPMTKALVIQTLEGIVTPRRNPGRLDSEGVFNSGMQLASQYRAQEEAMAIEA